MFKSMVSLRLTVQVKPVNGIGEVGTSTANTGSLAAQAMSSMLSPVTKANCQMPLRGYSTATTRVNSISRSLNMKSVTCLTEEYTLRTRGSRVMPRSNWVQKNRPIPAARNFPSR
jgi:hypothetical protein